MVDESDDLKVKKHRVMGVQKRSTEVSSSLSDFQREMRCVAQPMDARRGAQPMVLPLARVATLQTPLRRATRRAGTAFGALTEKRMNKTLSISRKYSTSRCAKSASGALAMKVRQAASNPSRRKIRIALIVIAAVAKASSQ